MSLCFSGLQRDHRENQYERDWSRSRFRACMQQWRISWVEAASSRQIDVSEAFSLCWRTMWILDMARRTCFREEYYTGMRRYYWDREYCRPRPKKTMCRIWSVFHWYLWIDQFVWARSVCGTRISCPASVDPSGATGKIYMRKIRWGQGPLRDLQHSASVLEDCLIDFRT